MRTIKEIQLFTYEELKNGDTSKEIKIRYLDCILDVICFRNGIYCAYIEELAHDDRMVLFNAYNQHDEISCFEQYIGTLRIDESDYYVFYK